MDQKELIPHLFRTEFRKIASVLCKSFGIEHIEAAEDIASDTFLLAFETWPFKGTPENPAGWLYAVAKNKARNYINRNHIFSGKVLPAIEHSAHWNNELDIDLSDSNITDSQLQMLFALCHPSIPPDAQIGLSLRILCGFGIEEIANAFLTSKETINKRLFRAREKLRLQGLEIQFPPESEINNRLKSVLTTLYLLFNEGYYSESRDVVLREDLCLEAMRLTYLLLNNENTNLPAVNALFSLMCFHSSRFPARKDTNGKIILYEDQNETLWNRELIEKGVYYLNQASRGDKISRYHLEANIAYWHTIKTDTQEKWNQILQSYNQLLQIEYSPIAALNRTFALSKTNGNKEAIREAEKLQLTGNPYYHVLLGELYKELNAQKAVEHLRAACTLARTQSDKKTIREKIDRLNALRV